MTILVDALPTTSDECLFSQYIQLVREFDIQEVLDDGSVVVDGDTTELIHGCKLNSMQCALEIGETCPCLATGYVTRF